METRKQRLIKGLNTVITALKNDTIHYEWTEHQSCNCGVVAQALLGKTSAEVKKGWLEANALLDGINKTRGTENKINKTWMAGIKHLCPLSGEPMVKIFKELFEAGLSKEDVVHLEYMNNPAILERSGIATKKTVIVTTQKLVGTEVKQVVKKHPNAILRAFGSTVTETIENNTYEEIQTPQEKKIDDFYQGKKNLIKYLTAWVQILQEETKYTATDNFTDIPAKDLENELLIAVADEKFEYAALLRDKINLK